RGAVKLHVPARHERVEGAGRGHAVRKPLPAAAAAVGVAGAAVAVAARAAVVAVDERYRSGEAVADQRRRGLDADAREAPLSRRDAHVARIEPGDLAEALIVRDAVDDEAVDGVEGEPRVGERLGERPQPERIGVVFRQLAVARVPHADDRDGFLTAHGFAPDTSGYIIALGSTNNPPLVIVRESGRSSNTDVQIEPRPGLLDARFRGHDEPSTEHPWRPASDICCRRARR